MGLSRTGQAQSQTDSCLVNRDSSMPRGKRGIYGERKKVRNQLYMTAMVASFNNPTLKLFHQRLRAAGKTHKVAVITVARKLLTMLNAMVRDNKPSISSPFKIAC